MADSNVSTERLSRWAIVFMGLMAVSFAIIYLKSILLPFIFSVLLTLMMAPLFRLIEGRLKVGRVVSVCGCWVLLIFLSLAFLATFGNIVQNFGKDVDSFHQIALDMISRSINSLKDMGIDIQIDQKTMQETFKNLPVIEIIRSTFSGLFSMFNDLFLVSLMTTFIVLGSKLEAPKKNLWREIDEKIRIYLVTKALVSVVTGALTWIILLSFGIKGAAFFGALAFALNFIPSIGSILASLMPIPIIIYQLEGVVEISFAILLPALVQFAIGNIVEPKLMGDSLDLHPVTILLFLMFWGMLWGVPGMLLATPLAVIVKIILSRLESGKNISDMMSGRYDI